MRELAREGLRERRFSCNLPKRGLPRMTQGTVVCVIPAFAIDRRKGTAYNGFENTDQPINGKGKTI